VVFALKSGTVFCRNGASAKIFYFFIFFLRLISGAEIATESRYLIAAAGFPHILL
jgi:hypothetical protein